MKGSGTVPIIFALVTFASTYAGGLFALKFKEKIHSIMAFAAGILLGVVSFDIFPEIFELTRENGLEPVIVMVAFAGGFILFHVLEKTVLIHHSHEEEYASHKHPNIGIVSSLALISHSFIDGASIGIGFQVNAAVGLFIAIAVISHGFADGMNTVTLMLSNNNTAGKAKVFLLFDALAPVAGFLFSFLIQLPPKFLTIYLGFFAGFILYIASSDILPEAHSKKSSLKLVGLTILGLVLIFAITCFLRTSAKIV
jgi:zinc transporter ZupT